MTGLKVGIVLPGRESVVDEGPYPRHLASLAALAEECGFDSVWAGESPLARSRMNPLLALTAAATATERLQLGTAVLMPLRPPVHLAHELACLDRISGGRLVAGIGSGFASPMTEREFANYGLDFGTRFGRMRETVEICQALWAARGEPVSYEGEHYRIEDAALLPVPERPQGPPLWIAHSGPKMLRRAGHRFDGWMPTSTSPEKYGEGWERVEAAREEAGRPPGAVTGAVYLSVAVDRSRERAEQTLRSYFRAYYGLPLETMRTTQGIFGGTPEEVADRLRHYVKNGARHLILRLPTGELSESGYRDAVRRTAAELLPLLRGL
ncbi:LLM class flavin-dependent oxidoreductase [Streptomyces sp. VRA16 Mangrove soil]|uniref:LLM class flavin-dependent oxidoreductase n=1 Tax=Streptomyces sp. VRA16 Mangrove soil TaxID=2817434 RepID=UPI001A9E205F|nr:LLM class flavin-dependent oxidoreductase [Streptomyces sp. VRA16 Mangrove soil]MBO1337179.1 LLM class flavin-dependent oxidoreductase [Streptomyces sp. VRA16 Mangrove soil]